MPGIVDYVRQNDFDEHHPLSKCVRVIQHAEHPHVRELMRVVSASVLAHKRSSEALMDLERLCSHLSLGIKTPRDQFFQELADAVVKEDMTDIVPRTLYTVSHEVSSHMAACLQAANRKM